RLPRWSSKAGRRSPRPSVTRPRSAEEPMAKTIAHLIEDRFGLATTAGADLPAEGTVAQFLSHRTHRRYRPDPVPDETLETVLAAALSAPSKSDLQQVAVIVVRVPANEAP